MNDVYLAFDFVFASLKSLWLLIRDYWFLCAVPVAFILWLVITLIRGAIDR